MGVSEQRGTNQDRKQGLREGGASCPELELGAGGVVERGGLGSSV